MNLTQPLTFELHHRQKPQVSAASGMTPFGLS